MSKISTWLLAAALAAAAPLQAGVTVGFDAPALNELLPALTLQDVVLPLAGGQSLRVELSELKILGFAPRASETAPDHILTSVVLRVPALGLTLPLQPRMALTVVEEGGQSLLELRFAEVAIPLPLAGSVDAAPFLDPLRFPADDVFLIAGAQGDVRVHSRLAKVEMGAKIVRFEFDLDVVEPEP